MLNDMLWWDYDANDVTMTSDTPNIRITEVLGFVKSNITTFYGYNTIVIMLHSSI